MKKQQLLSVFLLVSAIFTPQVTFAASVLDGLFNAPAPEIPNMMSCEVEGSIKQLNTTSNEITYKVKYTSNYSKANTAYTLYGRVTVAGVTRTLATLKGSAALTSGGTRYFSINGKQENTLRFAIKDNPGVTISMILDGINCRSKYFKTIDAMVNVQNQPALGGNVQLNGDAIQNDPVVLPQQGSQAGSGAAQNENGDSNGGNVVSNNAAGIQAGNENLSQPGGSAAAVDGSGVVAGEVSGDADGVVDRDGALENGVEEGREALWEEDGIKDIPSEKNEVEFNEWSARDIIIASLLGGIFVALIALGVMMYRGRV